MIGFIGSSGRSACTLRVPPQDRLRDAAIRGCDLSYFGWRESVPMTPSTPPRFFVSYNHADKAWAEWIAWQLEAEGHRVVIQDWDIRPGENFVLEMQRAAQEVDCTIAVLSPHYFRSEFTQSEWAAAFRRDPQGKKREFVPVRVEKCEPEGLLGPIVYIDLVGVVDSREARGKLLNGLLDGRSKPPKEPPLPRAMSEPAFPGPNDTEHSTPESPTRHAQEPYSVAAQAPDFSMTQRSSRSWYRIMAIGSLTSILMLLLLSLAWVVDKPATPTHSSFLLQVTVLDLRDEPVYDARVWSSFGGAPKQTAGGWQFDIPVGTVPADGKLTIFAEHGTLKGQVTTSLDTERTVDVAVRLSQLQSSIRGVIVDRAKAPVTGAQVSVLGSPDEIVATQDDGGFALPSHTVEGGKITLHIEHPEFPPHNHEYDISDTSPTITLYREINDSQKAPVSSKASQGGTEYRPGKEPKTEVAEHKGIAVGAVERDTLEWRGDLARSLSRILHKTHPHLKVQVIDKALRHHLEDWLEGDLSLLPGEDRAPRDLDYIFFGAIEYGPMPARDPFPTIGITCEMILIETLSPAVKLNTLLSHTGKARTTAGALEQALERCTEASIGSLDLSQEGSNNE